MLSTSMLTFLSSLNYREEVETPNVWAQVCIQRMVELARESTTVRQVLDPMFVYFDKGRHWVSPNGLAVVVLSDMSYFMESSGDSTFLPHFCSLGYNYF